MHADFVFSLSKILTGEGASLAEHRAATVLQCWERCIWLRRWFDQQALLKQKRIRLQTLCRGTSTYARLVQRNHPSPPTLTKKTSDPKVLHHPFRTRGQRLPPGKRADNTSNRIVDQVEGISLVLPTVKRRAQQRTPSSTTN
jgi:hypothetical protein